MNIIVEALFAAVDNYTPDTFIHALRVAKYVSVNPVIPQSKRETCVALALMHDLLEDTNYHALTDTFSPEFIYSLELLTKPKDEDYIEYIKRIKRNAEQYPEAYYVKLADMKDHLSQTETLTDRLKDKYLKALPYLL